MVIKKQFIGTNLEAQYDMGVAQAQPPNMPPSLSFSQTVD